MARMMTSRSVETVALAVPAVAPGAWCNRSRRVIVLIAGIIILSIGDLIVTLAFLQANWMIEANPIAAYLIRSTQSPWALAAFKMSTVAICVLVLYRLRHRAAGEVAAWVSVAILAIMSLMWRSYSTHFDGPND